MKSKSAIVYLHGIESHAGWFEGAASGLARRGFDVYCLERRGSGLNRFDPHAASGDIDHYQTWLEDVRDFAAQCESRYSHLILAGLSWGGRQALAAILAYPDMFDALILITPGLRGRLDVSWPMKLRILAASIFNPSKHFDLPLEAEMFSLDPGRVRMIRIDPLRLRRVTARFLMQSREMNSFIDDHLIENRTPILAILAEHDPIVDNGKVRKLLAENSRQAVTVEEFAGQLHSIQFDAVDRLVDRIDTWLKSQEGGLSP